MARLQFEMDREPGGGWKVARKSSRLLTPGASPADPEVLRVAEPYHRLAERYLKTPVAESAAAMDGRLCRVEDSALIDAVQDVELYYAKADVSLASCFNPRASVPKGGVTVRQIAALYPYDNELYAIEATGQMIKDALENSARYFARCEGDGCARGLLVNPKVMGYNFDIAQGVEYEIDLTRPEGSRIVKLRYHGQPLDPRRKLRLAVNNYRAAGSAGYTMFAGARVLWRSGDDIRDLMIRYYTERKKLPERADGNWRIVPAEALRALERQAEGR
jgi:2',3'-cyclic-nucleotide 2'-phosphodiesterase/3'-nucleotidase